MMTAAFSFLVEQPQNECELSDVLDPLLAASTCFSRGRHRRNAVIHAGSTLFEGRFEVFSLLAASVRSRDAFFVVLSLGTFFLAQVFLITSSSVFPIFSDKTTAPPEKVLRKRFSLPTNNQALWPTAISRRKRFSITFFLAHREEEPRPYSSPDFHISYQYIFRDHMIIDK